ncbi:hypothetical protein DH09_20140 [Bacillaceae bacterium JMAK1]|nr:hypothetical protein DH09_20140 [Bacillaceae bacterium JMAK1]
MKTFGKTMPTLCLSIVVLAACGSDEESATGSEVGDNEVEHNEIEDNENGTDEKEYEEGEMDTGNSGEEEIHSLEEGEEREAASTKEDHYIQSGIVIGGEITDGKAVGNIDHGIHDEYERLVLDIYEGAHHELGDPAEMPNHFEVAKEAYPSHFVYTLRGIRGLPEELPDLSTMDLFSSMEMIPFFDDATIKLAVYVQEPVEFEVFEMHNPAKIVTDIRSITSEEDYPTVYSVRTASISQEEYTESFQLDFEERDAERVRTLHSEGDTVFVEEGYYSTLEEAEERKSNLLNDGIDFDLHIEERGMYDTPTNIE